MDITIKDGILTVTRERQNAIVRPAYGYESVLYDATQDLFAERRDLVRTLLEFVEYRYVFKENEGYLVVFKGATHEVFPTRTEAVVAAMRNVDTYVEKELIMSILEES